MDLLKESLKKLVYDYAIKGRCADEKFVEQAITLIVDAKKLNDYVKDYKFYNTDYDNYLSVYDFNDKTVYIDIKNEVNHSLNRIGLERLNSSNFENLLKVNLSIVNAVVHELTYASQYKKCLSNKVDLERKILEIALERNLYIIRNGLIDKKVSNRMHEYLQKLGDIQCDERYYISLPNERMANLAGLSMEKSLARDLVCLDSPNIAKYCDLRYFKGQQLGYDEVCPTAFILTVNNKLKRKYGVEIKSGSVDFYETERILKRFGEKLNLTLDEKLYYGLPIGEEKMYAHKEKIKEFPKKFSR